MIIKRGNENIKINNLSKKSVIEKFYVLKNRSYHRTQNITRE